MNDSLHVFESYFAFCDDATKSVQSLAMHVNHLSDTEQSAKLIWKMFFQLLTATQRLKQWWIETW